MLISVILRWRYTIWYSFSSDFDFGMEEVLSYSCDAVHLFDFIFVTNEDISLLWKTFEVNLLHLTVVVLLLMFGLGVEDFFSELFEIVKWDLSYSSVEVNSFVLEYWVEEVIFTLLESVKGDLSHFSVTKHSFDLDSWVEEVFSLKLLKKTYHILVTQDNHLILIVELKKILLNYYLVKKYIHLNSICELKISFKIIGNFRSWSTVYWKKYIHLISTFQLQRHQW